MVELFLTVHSDELLLLTLTSSSQQFTMTSSPLQHTWRSSTQLHTLTSPAYQLARTSSAHLLTLMTSAINRTCSLRNQVNTCKTYDEDHRPNLTSSTYANRTTWEPGQLYEISMMQLYEPNCSNPQFKSYSSRRSIKISQ